MAQYNAISFMQGDRKLVAFAAPAKDIWDHFAINRRVENKDEGYQRALSPARVRKIAKYVAEGNGLPLSILVSIESGKFQLSGDTLTLNDEDDIGWVIDGQHRVAGAHESGSEITLPVIGFLGLNTEEQIAQFVTINREAKGVPTSLYYDLLKHLPTESPSDRAKARAVDIADALSSDEESVLFGRIVAVKPPQRGELSLTTFTKHASSLVLENKGFLAAYSMSDQVKIIANYFAGLKNALPHLFKSKDSVIFRTTGFGAIMRVFPNVFGYSLKLNQGFTVADVSRIFSQVSHFDFENWKKAGTGNAAEIQAADDLRVEIEEVVSADADGSQIRL